MSYSGILNKGNKGNLGDGVYRDAEGKLSNDATLADFNNESRTQGLQEALRAAALANGMSLSDIDVVFPLSDVGKVV